MRKPVEFDNYPIDIPFGPYRAVLKHWVDGDTCDAYIDQGLNKYAYETLRIRNLNTWEIYGQKDPGELEKGQAARQAALDLVPIGTPVKVVTYKDKTSFGRYIADIILEDGRDVATEMTRLGHAKPEAT